jgi:hypothetical protein
MKDWSYDKIIVKINPHYMNKTIYLKYSNSIGIFMKGYSRSTLNHELMHTVQSLKDPTILLVDYENQSVLTQIRGFFRKNAHNIELLKCLFYVSDKSEFEAFVHSFRKMTKEEKVELLSFALLLKYFNMKNLIGSQRVLRQFITIWMQYYGESSIPFLDRLRLNLNVRRNNIEINKEEIEEFSRRINEKFNKVGTEYIRKLSNQYSDTEEDVDKLVRYLNLAKLNIVRNDFKYVIDMSKNKKITVGSNRIYDVGKNW